MKLGPAAVAHGNLSVRITTRYGVSQPAPFSGGETVVIPNQQVDIREGTSRLEVTCSYKSKVASVRVAMADSFATIEENFTISP